MGDKVHKLIARFSALGRSRKSPQDPKSVGAPTTPPLRRSAEIPLQFTILPAAGYRRRQCDGQALHCSQSESSAHAFLYPRSPCGPCPNVPMRRSKSLEPSRHCTGVSSCLSLGGMDESEKTCSVRLADRRPTPFLLQTRLKVSTAVVGKGSYGVVFKGTFLDREVSWTAGAPCSPPD